jgi:hypothetical protein
MGIEDTCVVACASCCCRCCSNCCCCAGVRTAVATRAVLVAIARACAGVDDDVIMIAAFAAAAAVVMADDVIGCVTSLPAGVSGVVGREDVTVSPPTGTLTAVTFAECTDDVIIACVADDDITGACALSVAAAIAAGVFATNCEDAMLTTFEMLVCEVIVTIFGMPGAGAALTILGMLDGVVEIFATLGKACVFFVRKRNR